MSKKLYEMNSIRFDSVAKKSIVEMFNRAKSNTPPSQGGTPVDTGELRLTIHGSGVRNGSTVTAFDAEIGYVKEYAPHVEYGHRTVDGGWVPGQSFLGNNVNIQRPIYKADLISAIKKG